MFVFVSICLFICCLCVCVCVCVCVYNIHRVPSDCSAVTDIAIALHSTESSALEDGGIGKHSARSSPSPSMAVAEGRGLTITYTQRNRSDREPHHIYIQTISIHKYSSLFLYTYFGV